MNERYLSKAKRIDNGEWEIGSLIALPTGEYEISNKCNNPPDCDPMWDKVVITHKVDPSTICQCTGLKDKNGKLIWENDVVEIGEHEDSVNGLYKVIYCEINFCYALERSIDFHYNFFTFSALNGFETSSEVIGNIFDNPELLEGGE
jgi:uncharacterized phage protein (TIGR01671 family)|nr:MAG TPA: YopX protein [Caudoviricetes sp.]